MQTKTPFCKIVLNGLRAWIILLVCSFMYTSCNTGTAPSESNQDSITPMDVKQVDSTIATTKDSPANTLLVAPPPPPPPMVKDHIVPEITAVEEESVEETVELYNDFLNAQPEPKVAEPIEAMEPRNEVIDYAEQMPEFNYRDQTVQMYLKNNIRYPETARDEGRAGTVHLRFVVETDGKVSGVEIIKSSGFVDLDWEACRIIRLMPDWKPGKQNGKPVRVLMALPVRFVLE